MWQHVSHKRCSGAVLVESRASSLFEQPDHEQENHRSDDGVDDVRDDAAAESKSNPRQEPTGNERPDNSNHDVADQPKAVTLDNLAREPARYRPYDQPNYKTLYCHGRLSPLHRRKFGAPKFLLGNYTTIAPHSLWVHDDDRLCRRGICDLSPLSTRMPHL